MHANTWTEIGSRTDDGMTEIGETPCNLMCIESSILSPFVWVAGVFGGGESSGDAKGGSKGGSKGSAKKDLLPRDEGSPVKTRRFAMPATPESTASERGRALGGAVSDAAATEALERYFNALCDHNVTAACECLDADILVRYPEQGKGWSSAATARQKYARMLARAPAFKASFSVLEVTAERSVSTIRASCHFECAVSGLNVTREILYVVGGDQRIILIDHK